MCAQPFEDLGLVEVFLEIVEGEKTRVVLSHDSEEVIVAFKQLVY